MDIFYTKETLFVEIIDKISENTVNLLEKRIFNILEDYDIEKIVVKILSEHDFDSQLIDNFIINYNNKFKGSILIS